MEVIKENFRNGKEMNTHFINTHTEERPDLQYIWSGRCGVRAGL
jgi:hypothetical protein